MKQDGPGRRQWDVWDILTFLWTSVFGGGVGLVAVIGLAWSCGAHIYDFGRHDSDRDHFMAATKSDVTGIHLDISSLRTDVQELQQTTKDNHTDASNWRSEVTSEIENTNDRLDGMQGRIDRLEGGTQQIIGAVATAEGEISFGRCCEHHDCRTHPENCQTPKRRKD